MRTARELELLGLELLLSLTLKWAQDSGLALSDALATITHRPASVLGASLGALADQIGGLSPGAVADICVFDAAAHWVVEPGALRSQGKHTPFGGYELPGRVRTTLVGGQVAFSA